MPKEPPKYQAPPEERRSPLDPQKKEEMLAVVVRNPEAYESVSELLTIGQVRKFSEPLSVLWRVVRKFHTKYGELPDKTQIAADIHNTLKADPDILDKEECAELDEFLDYAFDDKEHGKNIAKSKKHCRVAIETCRQILEEHAADDFQQALTKDGTLPADLPHLLETSRAKLDQINSLTEIDIGLPFPDGWDNRADAKLFSTGVCNIDAFAGGGWRAGEIFLFLAPYGSCKTVVVAQGVANQIRHAAKLLATGQARKNDKGELMTPVVVLLFTESDENEYRDRLLSNLAVVQWSRLAEMTSLSALSNGSKPGAKKVTKYELSEFADQNSSNSPWKSERARVVEQVTVANKHLLLVNCTDAEDSPYEIGSGGMPQIANVLRSLFRKRKDIYPVSIWLDHVSGLVDRMSDELKDEAQLRRTLTNIPRVARDKIAKPLKTPIMLIHQLSGEANLRGVTAKFHHADAEGAKSIGKYVNFAIVSGPVDGNGYCKWEGTKRRRVQAQPARITRIRGDFNRIEDATETHGIPTGSTVIVAKAELTSYGVTTNHFAGKKGSNKGASQFNNMTDY